jgi:hypothetical protein
MQCLVLRNLAGDTYLVFCLGGMTMKQPEAMKNDETQQRQLDDPDAQTVLPGIHMLGHALSVNRSA